MPALNRVGEDFATGKMFLPQLLMSADAAKASFEVIKAYMRERGQAREPLGGVVLATVKGDVHDIGKNIVKVLLENYGFDVTDLGKDVAPETVMECVKRTGIRLVGLSALMTTTVAAMGETVALLKREIPECRVMVGGAVLTQSYANAIGADHYSPDAMDSVRFAQQFYGAE